MLGFMGSLSLVYVVASGCGDEEDPLARVGDGCTINSDCNDPLVCVFRRCHAQCEETRDCPDGQRCVIGTPPVHVCQLSDQASCQYNSQCAGDQVCAIDGQCRDQCQGDLDCLPGQVCATGTCADPDELVDGRLPSAPNPVQATGQPCLYTSECPDGLVCKDGLCNLECLGDADCTPFPCDLETNRCVIPDGGVEPLCTPGAQVTCGCAGGLEGQQVCAPSGFEFGPCTDCQ
jgi:hypothetical protein